MQRVSEALQQDEIVLQHCRADSTTCPAAARSFLAMIDRAQGRSG